MEAGHLNDLHDVQRDEFALSIPFRRRKLPSPLTRPAGPASGRGLRTAVALFAAAAGAGHAGARADEASGVRTNSGAPAAQVATRVNPLIASNPAKPYIQPGPGELMLGGIIEGVDSNHWMFVITPKLFALPNGRVKAIEGGKHKAIMVARKTLAYKQQRAGVVDWNAMQPGGSVWIVGRDDGEKSSVQFRATKLELTTVDLSTDARVTAGTRLAATNIKPVDPNVPQSPEDYFKNIGKEPVITVPDRIEPEPTRPVVLPYLFKFEGYKYHKFVTSQGDKLDEFSAHLFGDGGNADGYLGTEKRDIYFTQIPQDMPGGQQLWNVRFLVNGATWLDFNDLALDLVTSQRFQHLPLFIRATAEDSPFRKFFVAKMKGMCHGKTPGTIAAVLPTSYTDPTTGKKVLITSLKTEVIFRNPVYSCTPNPGKLPQPPLEGNFLLTEAEQKEFLENNPIYQHRNDEKAIAYLKEKGVLRNPGESDEDFFVRSAETIASHVGNPNNHYADAPKFAQPLQYLSNLDTQVAGCGTWTSSFLEVDSLNGLITIHGTGSRDSSRELHGEVYRYIPNIGFIPVDGTLGFYDKNAPVFFNKVGQNHFIAYDFNDPGGAMFKWGFYKGATQATDSRLVAPYYHKMSSADGELLRKNYVRYLKREKYSDAEIEQTMADKIITFGDQSVYFRGQGEKYINDSSYMQWDEKYESLGLSERMPQ